MSAAETSPAYMKRPVTPAKLVIRTCIDADTKIQEEKNKRYEERADILKIKLHRTPKKDSEFLISS